MNDFDRAASKIGNRFNLVLVASERLREIHRERKLREEVEKCDLSTRKNQPTPSYVVYKEIEEGKVGLEYLNKIKARGAKTRPKFDAI